ncbi:MAG TPA: hypothetical protein DGG94_16030 [Micromonosporaceae bacterium]|nr:hypothetical protein [Micromonosporaceae bacterium]HCU51278.1 hypothetical protein [Micromonosporaceae bacterium]
MPSPDPFQSQVAHIALEVAAAHGFALGGGQALIAHGIVKRPTEDIDLFTDSDDGVRNAMALVEASLSSAGLEVEIIPETSELGDIFYGFENDMAEFEVRRGAEQVRLTLARFDRTKQPVTLDIGAVLHIDDVIGSKVAAMATRAEPRDFVDVAAAMSHYDRVDLLALAMRSDPALTNDEIAEAMRTLDRIPDPIFGQWIAVESVGELRTAFADWPRS